MSARWILAILAAAVGAGGVLRLAMLAPDEAPNVILVSIDSLRPDHLGCYGYERDTSPNIDRLAREGALFETVVSSTSWTSPAHAALFTALPDRVHGCVDDARWLDGTRHTIAEALREVGYQTVGFFSGPYLHPSFGLSQGFDRYQDCTSYSAEFIRSLKTGKVTNLMGFLRQELQRRAHEDVTNPIVLREVMKWLDSEPEGPFFLFIHMWDVHFDYVPPPPYDTKFDPGYAGPVDGRNVPDLATRPRDWTQADEEHLEALYDGEIAWTDETLGEILTELDARGLADRSIVAVTADHGEAFYEHGQHGHRWTLFDEEIRIPLVVRYPPAIEAGLRVTEPVHIIDVAPTLLELAGVRPLRDAVGRSLAPLLRSGSALRESWPEQPAVSELEFPARRTHLFALRTKASKRIYDLENLRMQTFDLVEDPLEQSPISREGIDEPGGPYEDATKRLLEASKRLPTPGERDTPPISKMTEEQLRRLGYID